MLLLQTTPDSTAYSGTTAYDSVWADPSTLPTQPPSGIESVMLSHDKLYVVLAVVLIIWFGLLFFILRTDRKLERLEEQLPAKEPERL